MVKINLHYTVNECIFWNDDLKYYDNDITLPKKMTWEVDPYDDMETNPKIVEYLDVTYPDGVDKNGKTMIGIYQISAGYFHTDVNGHVCDSHGEPING